MKQFIPVTLTMLVVAGIASPALAGGQIELGAFFGPNTSNLVGEDRATAFGDVNPWGLDRSAGGVFARFEIAKYFSVMPQLIYSKKGCRIFDSEVDDGIRTTYTSVVRLDYIEMPILLHFKPHLLNNLNPYVVAGPSISLAFSGEVEHRLGQTTSTGEIIVESYTLDRVDMYNVADIQMGVVVGVGVDFRMGRYGLAVEGRFSADLNNAFSDISDLGEVPDDEDALVDADGTAPELKSRSGSLLFIISYALGI